MPLMGIAEYSPYHSWFSQDFHRRADFDSGPVAMRLRDEAATSSSSSNSSPPAFPPSSSSPSFLSGAVATQPPTSVSSYHQPALLQINADAVTGSAIFSQKQQQVPNLNLQQPILTSQISSKPKMMNEPLTVNNRNVNGFGGGVVQDSNSKQLLSYFLMNNSSNTGIDGSSSTTTTKLTLNGLIDQMNGSESYYRWLQQNALGSSSSTSSSNSGRQTTTSMHHQQQQQQQSPTAFYAAPDYDPWHFQPSAINGHCNGFAASKKPSNGFYEHPPSMSNGTQTGSSSVSSSSSSSCYSNGVAQNGFSSNGLVDSVNNDTHSSMRAKRSTSLTPPSDSPFDQQQVMVNGNGNGYERGHHQQRSSMNGNVAWLNTTNGHDDVFSNMNTFDVQALHQNDDGREFYGRHENGFSPEQSRNGSGSGSASTSGGEHAESPVQQNSVHLMKNTFLEPGSGMRNVPVWLKTLRLHKYEFLFSQLTYDEMMQLTVERLAEQKVCEGARKKIILSIQKLRDRVNLLKQLERELSESGGIKSAAVALKSIIDTPIRAYTGPAGHQNLVDVDQALIDGLDVDVNLLDDDNLPAHFTRVLYKTCRKIVDSTSTGLDDECVGACLFALDRCLNNEAFTLGQKRRLVSLKQQVRRIYTSMPRKLAPRSNSWNKDRRQSTGGNGYCGMGGGGGGNNNSNNRSSNNSSNTHSLHRQSSLGTNGVMVSTYSRGPSTDSTTSSTAYVQSKIGGVGGQKMHMQTVNGSSSLAKVMEQTSQSNTPSYASAVLSSMNGQRMQKAVERDDVQANMQQCRPVQRTISAPPLRQTGAAGGSQVAISSANTSANMMASNGNQAGACVSIDGAMMPAYCWPPSSVFSAGPIVPPTPSPSRFGTAWSCGFEEATSTRPTSYHHHHLNHHHLAAAPATLDGTLMGCYNGPIFQQQKNGFGTGQTDSSGYKYWEDGNNGLFGPVVGAFSSDWNSRLEQLCRSITDATIGIEN